MLDFEGILREYSLDGFPAGLTGCRNGGQPHGGCEYDLAVFDERDENDTIVKHGGNFVCIRHCSLSAPRSAQMVHYDGMSIVSDESWQLHMMLSRIREKRAQIYSDYMRDSLIDSMFCATKFKEGAKTSDPLAPCWIKCSATYMADAMLLSVMEKPSQSHALQKLRGMKKKIPSEAFSIVTDCMGAERATQSLLARMTKSTAGFSDTVEGNGRSKLILNKAECLSSESLLADCYFYLQYANRDMIARIKNEIAKKPDLFYILKISMDVGADAVRMEDQAQRLHAEASRMLAGT